MRVALLMTGCAQQVLAPEINEATIRLLTRHGAEVVVPHGGRAAVERSPITWAWRIGRAGPPRVRNNIDGVEPRASILDRVWMRW